MRSIFPVLGTISSFLLSTTSVFAVSPFNCPEDTAVCSFEDTSLPVRVVVRPASALLSDPDAEANVLASNLPAFRPWFVYDSVDIDYTDPKNPTGFFQVGVTKDSGPRGWLPAKDTFIWKSNIVVTYAPRGTGSTDERSRVILFDDFEKAQGLLEASDPTYSYSDITAALASGDGDLLEKAGVVLAEPKVEVSFQNGFYIMPVIDHKELEVGFGETARYLQIAAAVPQTEEDLGRGTTTVRDQDTLAEVEASAGSSVGGIKEAADVEIDIVFAIDMTGSMQPYLDATAQSVTQVVGEFERAGLEDAVNYGLVGYTDIPKECGGCLIDVAKNLTPELTTGANITSILGEKSWASDGGDWQEAVFSGAREAITSTKWNENSLKFVIVIGDALSRTELADGSPITADLVTSLAANTAPDGRIQVVALHAKPSNAGDANAIAEKQFRAISADPTGQSSLYYGFPIDPENPDEIERAFQTTLKSFLSEFVPTIEALRSGDSEKIAEIIDTAKAINPGDDLTVKELAPAAIAPQLVEYLGTAKERPRDLVAWTTDVDPVQPQVTSLEVRVLVDKRELSDLVATMQKVRQAYIAAELTGGDFFVELQALGVKSTLDVETTSSERIAKSGLAPRWIETLPYKSRLLAMTPDVFANMDPSQREDFEVDLDVKISILKEYLNNPDVWVKMAPDVPELATVFPVPLIDLP